MSRSSKRIAWLALAVLATAAGPARAHGPTVSVTADAADPAELRIPKGQTVHFVNAGAVAVRVRGEGDSFHSPVLEPGGAGWHLPFPFPGTFPYRVEPEQQPDGAESAVRGAIVVETPD
jgi:plastocyanin